MSTVITGSASGMGAATLARLRARGVDVIGVDLAGSDVDCDLGDPAGRERVVAAVGDSALDAIATFAGVSGFGGRPGSLVVSVNYFGTVGILEPLRANLGTAGGAAVAISSNSATGAPNVDDELVEACLDGDEAAARARGDVVGGPAAYASSKLAVARWVRRSAPTEQWAGSGVRLNAIAPGHIETALTEEMMAEPEAREVIERSPLPIGQPGRPEDIAALADLLLGDEGRFFSGSVIYMDGGVDALYRADDWPTARRRKRR